MTCERTLRLMGVWRELERAERRAVAEHLRGCDACHSAWRDEERVRAIVRAIPSLDAPRALEGRLLAIPASAGPHLPLALGRGVLAVVATGALALLGLRLGPALVEGGTAAPRPAGAIEAAPDGRAALGAVGTPVARRGRVTLETPASRPPAPESGASGASDVPPAAAPAGQASRPAPRGRAVADVAPPPVEAPPAADEGAPEDDVRPSETPAARACSMVRVSVFADLAGAGPLGCEGCDGVWDAADEARARALGVSLPSFQIDLYDADGETLAEVAAAPDGPRHEFDFGEVCAPLPLTVQIVGLPAAWSACPGAGGLARTIDAPGEAALGFGLHDGCPPPTATPTESATPSAPPGEATPAATGEPTASPAAAGPAAARTLP